MFQISVYDVQCFHKHEELDASFLAIHLMHKYGNEINSNAIWSNSIKTKTYLLKQSKKFRVLDDWVAWSIGKLLFKMSEKVEKPIDVVNSTRAFRQGKNLEHRNK